MHAQISKTTSRCKPAQSAHSEPVSSIPAAQTARLPAWTRALDVLPLQTRLMINQPGDTYEQEADRVADQVMRMPEPQVQRKCACGGTAGPDGECAACKHRRMALQRQVDEADEQIIQPKGGPAPGMATAPPSVHQTLRSAGQPLAAPTRAFMEPRFGADFSHVRVHTNPQAAESARAINARAYTVGRNVVFGAGQYATHPGRRLLAHELTHVVQQQSNRSARLSVPQLLSDDSDLDGAGEYVLEKQRRRPRREGAAVNVAPPERIEAFFAPNSQMMRSVNPHRSAVNCPATAAAVDEYLGTGAVNPAPSGSPRSVFGFAQRWVSVSNLTMLLRRTGSYVAVRGTRSQEYANLQGVTREHYFVVVNRGGSLWVLDGYNHRTMPLDQFLANDQFETLEYFRGPFRVTHIPNPPPGVGRP